MTTTSAVLPKNQSVDSKTVASDTILPRSYNPDQQLKYLHLQAEVEVLLQQLQTLKLRRTDVPQEN